MSATVVAIAMALGLLVNGITGAQRFSGHTFRVTRAMYLVSCGLDVWRIQLHCRWGSNSVLRHVRLAPLSGSVALEASSGRDLKHVERTIVAAKAELGRPSQLSRRSKKAWKPLWDQTSPRPQGLWESLESTRSWNATLKTTGIAGHLTKKSQS